MTFLKLVESKTQLSVFKCIFLVINLMCVQFTTQSQSYFTDLEDSIQPGLWLGTQTIDTLHAFSGKHASLITRGQPYGIGFEGEFPEEIAGKNAWLKFESQVFSESNEANALFVVTLMDQGQLECWQGVSLKTLVENPRQWNAFSDSIKIPSNLTKNATIKAYFWNENLDVPVWIDDLRLSFSPVQQPSYIPDLEVYLPSTMDGKVLFSNAFYQIKYNEKTKDITIQNADGIDLVQSILYYSNRIFKAELYENKVRPEFVRKQVLGSETQLYFRIKTKLAKISVVFSCDNYLPKIEVGVTETYRKKQQVSRESFVFSSGQPLEKVFRANRKTDTANFQSEYWLDQQGVQFGTTSSGWWMYHQPKISSLQLNTNKNQLWVNLDYDRDHPYFRFPLNPDSSNWKVDESASAYKSRNKRHYSFTWNVYNKPLEIPRFMKNPSGFLATFIWTEHADWTNIRSNRASYFGSEKITDAKESIGGFVKYNIPVTKSVFYANPDSIKNTEISNGTFNELESSILTDPDFLYFLHQIYNHNTEICLHTPEQYTTTPAMFNEALAFMESEFGSVSWIDHGNNNGIQNNREDLVCDATLKKSPYYALELWPRYGIRYLHNSYFEDMPGVDFWQFEGSLGKPYSGFGDFWPKADYWKHVTKSNDMIHWPTTSALFVESDGVWDYFFSEKKLNDFVDQWETKINHSYPAWVNPKKGFWTYNHDSVMVAQPGFNRTLQRMAKVRDEGQLNVCTIETYLDYRTALDSVDYQVLPDGRIQLTNTGSKLIEQLAMITMGDYILVNGLKSASKMTTEGRLFWFDLPAGERVNIRILSNK